MISYKTITSLQNNDHKFFGHKACYLSLIELNGFQTPKGIVFSIDPSIKPFTDQEKQYLAAIIEKTVKPSADNPLAIRSSTPWEDGDNKSYAGQFTTILNCQNSNTSIKAMEKIKLHAATYAIEKNLSPLPLGVIVQPEISGDISGVCFTSHWLKHETLGLEYTQGHCKKVVEGQTNLTREFFHHKEIEQRESPTKIEKVAQKLWELRKTMRKDLDIEWTLRKDELIILQARPLTNSNSQDFTQKVWQDECYSLSNNSQPNDLLTSLSISEVFGSPKTLFNDLIQQTLSANGPIYKTFQKLGLTYKPKDPCFYTFCGRPHINLSAYARCLNLNIKFKLSGAPNSPISFSISPWSFPTIIKLIKAIFRATRLKKEMLASQNKQGHPKPNHWNNTKNLLLQKLIPTHLEADVVSGVHDACLRKIIKLFTKQENKAAAILQAYTVETKNSNLGTNWDLYLLGKKKISWEDFKNRHGHRGQPDWDISAPRFAERRVFVEKLAQTIAQSDAPLREARSKRRSRLLIHFLKDKFWFKILRKYIEDNAKLIHIREESQNQIYHHIAQLRQFVINQAHNTNFPQPLAFFLKEYELLSLPEEKEKLKKAATDRQNWHQAAVNCEIATNFYAKKPKNIKNTPSQKTLTGLGISIGIYQGKAYIAQNLSDALAMPKGDILIIPKIDPSWSAILYLAGAIVCEQGGLFCHSSILIREHGIPAVVNVPNAITTIKPQSTIKVDGITGKVSSII